MKGGEMINSIINLTIDHYERYLYMYLDKERNLASRLMKLRFSIRTEGLKFCCFSSWDFVPENICLTALGLKYIDPRKDIIGIPIVDLACFAGLIRLYDLPEATKGYQMFKEFALTRIPSILDIPEGLPPKIFFLGRVLQCFLSARFRITNKPEQARQIFSEGQAYLEKNYINMVI